MKAGSVIFKVSFVAVTVLFGCLAGILVVNIYYRINPGTTMGWDRLGSMLSGLFVGFIGSLCAGLAIVFKLEQTQVRQILYLVLFGITMQIGYFVVLNLQR